MSRHEAAGTAAPRQEAAVSGVRVRVVAAWAVAFVLAFSFVQTGLAKLLGAGAGAFGQFGYAPWFARVVGALELLGGLLVLWPSRAAWGAGLLAIVMLGAVATHLATGVGSPTEAATMLALAGILIALRTPEMYWPGRRNR